MAQKQARSALKAALTAKLNNTLRNDGALNDGAFITRWIAAADDPVFERLGDKIAACGVIGTDLELIYRVVIASARQARRISEDVKNGRDPRVTAAEKNRAKALDLAQKADDLATFCRDSGVSGKLDLVSLLSPWRGLETLLGQHGMLRLHQLAEFHEREANLLRRFVLKQQIPAPRARISRQRRGREHVAFMHQMVCHMRELCRTPQYDAVAAVTNIAFPKADATAENVRAACRPTTRSGRRRNATSALNNEV
jgi:hypothetical protein